MTFKHGPSLCQDTGNVKGTFQAWLQDEKLLKLEKSAESGEVEAVRHGLELEQSCVCR